MDINQLMYVGQLWGLQKLLLNGSEKKKIKEEKGRKGRLKTSKAFTNLLPKLFFGWKEN